MHPEPMRPLASPPNRAKVGLPLLVVAAVALLGQAAPADVPFERDELIRSMVDASNQSPGVLAWGKEKWLARDTGEVEPTDAGVFWSSWEAKPARATPDHAFVAFEVQRRLCRAAPEEHGAPEALLSELRVATRRAIANGAMPTDLAPVFQVLREASVRMDDFGRAMWLDEHPTPSFSEPERVVIGEIARDIAAAIASSDSFRTQSDELPAGLYWAAVIVSYHFPGPRIRPLWNVYVAGEPNDDHVSSMKWDLGTIVERSIQGSLGYIAHAIDSGRFRHVAAGDRLMLVPLADTEVAAELERLLPHVILPYILAELDKGYDADPRAIYAASLFAPYSEGALAVTLHHYRQHDYVSHDHRTFGAALRQLGDDSDPALIDLVVATFLRAIADESYPFPSQVTADFIGHPIARVRSTEFNAGINQLWDRTADDPGGRAVLLEQFRSYSWIEKREQYALEALRYEGPDDMMHRANGYESPYVSLYDAAIKLLAETNKERTWYPDLMRTAAGGAQVRIVTNVLQKRVRQGDESVWDTLQQIIADETIGSTAREKARSLSRYVVREKGAEQDETPSESSGGDNAPRDEAGTRTRSVQGDERAGK